MSLPSHSFMLQSGSCFGYQLATLVYFDPRTDELHHHCNPLTPPHPLTHQAHQPQPSSSSIASWPILTGAALASPWKICSKPGEPALLWSSGWTWQLLGGPKCYNLLLVALKLDGSIGLLGLTLWLVLRRLTCLWVHFKTKMQWYLVSLSIAEDSFHSRFLHSFLSYSTSTSTSSQPLL